MRSFLYCVLLIVTTIAFGCQCGGRPIYSMEDLDRYKFIGLVKIDSVYQLPEDTLERRRTHHINFSIIELYRGDSISQLAVHGGNQSFHYTQQGSCDLGEDPGEVWILFAYENRNSKLETGLCSFSRRYRSKTGERDWLNQIGIKRVKKVKELLNIPEKEDPIVDGQFIERYPNGSIELVANYTNGLLDGERTIYHSNGQIMAQEHYVLGSKEGKSLWYYKDGTRKRDYTYKDNHPIDSCWNYDFDGMVNKRMLFSSKGRKLFSATYFAPNQLSEKTIVDTLKNDSVRTSYYLEGPVRSTTTKSIGSELNGDRISYYRNGKIRETSNSFEEGDYKYEIKRWDKEGILIYHLRIKRDGEKIVLKNTYLPD